MPTPASLSPISFHGGAQHRFPGYYNVGNPAKKEKRARVNRPDPGTPSGDAKWADAISRADNLVRREKSAGPDTPRPLPGQRTVILGVGLILAVVVAFVSPLLMPGSPSTLSAAEQASDLRAEAALLVEQIEAYRAEYGGLPDPEVLAPYLDEGYDYRILDPTVGQFEVRRSAGGIEVTYDGTLSLGLWLVVGGTTTEGPG